MFNLEHLANFDCSNLLIDISTEKSYLKSELTKAQNWKRIFSKFKNQKMNSTMLLTLFKASDYIIVQFDTEMKQIIEQYARYW